MKRLMLLFLMACISKGVVAQKAKSTAAFYTGVYPNIFKEAGYSKADIDTKVNKAYYDLFEGPGKVYFEVGDSLAYVSDIKNHDARTEGLSYGMMIAVQLNKKMYLTASGVGLKNICSTRMVRGKPISPGVSTRKP